MINNVSNSRKIMSRFGDLLKGETTTPEPTVVIETPEPPEPVEVKVDFGVMSKDELEDYGRTIGIELDRRLSKGKLVKQLEDHIQYIESV